MPSLRAAAAVLVLFCSASPVRADEEERKQLARGLIDEGIRRYDLGRYDDAIDYFARAYEVYPFPEALLGLGQAYRQKKNYERAAFYLRAYLRNKPDAANRDVVIELIDEMDRMAAEEREAAKKPPTGVDKPSGPGVPPPPASTSNLDRSARWYHDALGWAAAGTGTLGTVVAIALFVDAANLDDQADREIDQAVRGDLRDRADTRRTYGAVIGPVGVVALVVGIVKLAWVDGAHRSSASHVVLGPSWVGWFWSF